MYRINLYPKGQEKRIERAGRVRRLAALTFLSGAAVVFVGLFGLSALAVKDQADAADKLAASLKQQMSASQKSESRAAINQIRQLVDKRCQRLDWSPTLAEIAAILPDNLILEKIEAFTMITGGDRFLGLTLFGRLASGRNVESVIKFAGRLSESDIYKRQFSEAKVGRVDTSGDVAHFSIVCPQIAAKPADPEEEGG